MNIIILLTTKKIQVFTFNISLCQEKSIMSYLAVDLQNTNIMICTK